MLLTIFRTIKRLPAARRAKRDTEIITSLLGVDTINLVDLGAAGGVEPRWKKISSALNYTGLEPDERVQEILPSASFSKYELLPFAAGELEGSQNLYITKDGGKSSTFLPNQEFLERFPDSGRFEVIDKTYLQTKLIDNIIFSNIDFIKLDIQGSELSALRGATNKLGEVLGIEVEVEFSKLYIDQPLFGTVHEFLSEHDFEFYDFIILARWERQSLKGIGQLVFGDALYLKSPESVLQRNLSDSTIRKYLAILFIYNRFDLIEIVFLQKSNLRIEVKHFYRYQKRKAILFYFIHKVNRAITALYSLIGIELRSHVIY
jgi:FkbM family methyltransferase